MIYITGDTHGNWMSRLNSSAFPEGKEMTKDDYVIVCGDFGIWDNSASEKYALKWLDKKQFTTLFVDGTHENFDLLDNYPVTEWHGGKIHQINDSVIHLMRGQVYDICDKKIFTFGGASSHDVAGGIFELDDPELNQKVNKAYDKNLPCRINHLSWWERELPNAKEMQEGKNNLSPHDNKVDYIITHCPDSGLLKQMGSGLYKTDILSDYLLWIKLNIEYDRWFFGHMHVDDNFLHEKCIGLYEQIIRIA